MTDIIALLKEPEAHYPGNFDTPKRANAMLSCLCQEAMEEIESLRRELKDMTNQYNAALEAEQVRYQQLAASQALEQQLLKKVENYKILCQDENNYSHYLDALEALAIPQDTTALESMITSLGEVMRERCIEASEDYNGKRGEHDGTAIAHLIRAIPGVTLEDLK